MGKYFYYYCKSRKNTNGVACPYNKQWHQGLVNGAVEEVIHKMAYDELFADAIKQQINMQVDTSELDKELAILEKRLRSLTVAKDRVGFQIDGLDIDDPQYERRYNDLQARLDNLYSHIDATEGEIYTVENRIKNLEESKITADNIYSFLLNFESLYGLLSDLEKKQFMKVFVDEVQIFPDVQPNGKFLRSIKFSFPIPYEGSQIQEFRWDNSDTVETVVLMMRDHAEKH